MGGYQFALRGAVAGEAALRALREAVQRFDRFDPGPCAFAGRAIRDPKTFAAGWGKERRAEHIVVRSAFTQALWELCTGAVVVYRGMALRGPLESRPVSPVSATFSGQVAEAHFDAPETAAGALSRQRLTVERLFMTFLESSAMNERYLEAEVPLFADPSQVI
ncbi:hypothetical protein [Planobispora takensis]|uniref:Uncharacterized protein n=1 Tax=Planobispora takensis TaxID=1367882 RepID=A0A8J3T4T1_9ACTN|nr:hypothetical protein [Planobispora takensis]GII04080.1 hypothetical protein Pta02_60880 [Planobispora takensis]